MDGLSSFKAGPLASALGAGGPDPIWQTSMWPALQGLQDLIKPELPEGLALFHLIEEETEVQSGKAWRV